MKAITTPPRPSASKTLTPVVELRVVLAHIEALEKTLFEFKDPQAKAEIYRELSTLNAHRFQVESAIAVEEQQLLEQASEEQVAEEPIDAAPEATTSEATVETEAVQEVEEITVASEGEQALDEQAATDDAFIDGEVLADEETPVDESADEPKDSASAALVAAQALLKQTQDGKQSK